MVVPCPSCGRLQLSMSECSAGCRRANVSCGCRRGSGFQAIRHSPPLQDLELALQHVNQHLYLKAIWGQTLFNLQHAAGCRAESTVMVHVQHMLHHHKFCCCPVRIGPRVCAARAYLPWTKWTSETKSFAAGGENSQRTKGWSKREGTFVVTTSSNPKRTHSRVCEGWGSVPSTLLLDVGGLGTRSRTPHSAPCEQQRLGCHCWSRQSPFRQ